jgi:hypothetical protein
LVTWVLVAWNVLMIGWTATYLRGVGDCSIESGWQLTVCETGRAIGTQVGFPFILVVWIVGFAVLGMIWQRGRSA